MTIEDLNFALKFKHLSLVIDFILDHSTIVFAGVKNTNKVIRVQT